MYQVLLFKFGRHLCKGSIDERFSPVFKASVSAVFDLIQVSLGANRKTNEYWTRIEKGAKKWPVLIFPTTLDLKRRS